jgi:heterodisulfide reductase subunit A
MESSNVLVIGGGIAGLTATHELAKLGIKVELVEKEPFLGGHAIQFTCKAVESCAKCGACMAEEKLKNVIHDGNIIIHTGANLERISKNDHFHYNIQLNPNYIDPSKCTGCRICAEKCPVERAISCGFSIKNHPIFSINKSKCLYFKDKSCTICLNLCPEGAINPEMTGTGYSSSADAVIMATGFEPFDPVKKPYGYRVFKNVITNLDLEKMLKINGIAIKPSDGMPPGKIAFIQCVGSRDSKLSHLWCSKICCASALRMARVIKTRKPETSVTFFYIDIQGSGKDFETLYQKAKEDFRMIRAIPGDIYKTEDDRLKITYFDNLSKSNGEEVYDMVVLSVAMIPGSGTKELAEMLGIIPCDTGFVKSCENDDIAGSGGVFVAGTAGGPLSIAESITHAVKTAWDVAKYLKAN